jgi:hypothetical protein
MSQGQVSLTKAILNLPYTDRSMMTRSGLCACTMTSAGIDPLPGACNPSKSQYSSTVLLPTRADFRENMSYLIIVCNGGMNKVEYLSDTSVRIYSESYYRTRPNGLVPKIFTRHFTVFTGHCLVVRCLCTSLPQRASYWPSKGQKAPKLAKSASKWAMSGHILL